jgi:TfoX/Sxy family transcriptional regulator of competence genes
MAFNEEIVERLRAVFLGRTDVVEKKMFGGIAFMMNGHMSVGVNGDDLMVRVGPDLYDHALAQPHARKMDFTGRSMKGFVFVDTAGFATAEELTTWTQLSEQFVRQLPPK